VGEKGEMSTDDDRRRGISLEELSDGRLADL